MRDALAVILPNILLWLVFISVIWGRFRGSVKGRLKVHEVVLLLFFLVSLPAGPTFLNQIWVPPNSAIDQVTVPEDAQPVVMVFGGGVRALPQTASWPTEASMRRGVTGSAVAQKYNWPLFITGAENFYGGPTEAALVANFLTHPGTVVLDEKATNTWENALAAKSVLAASDRTGVIAVTDASHARRARACLLAAGVPVFALVVSAADVQYGWLDFVPHIKAFTIWRDIGYELTASAAYVANGRIGMNELFSQ